MKVTYLMLDQDEGRLFKTATTEPYTCGYCGHSVHARILAKTYAPFMTTMGMTDQLADVICLCECGRITTIHKDVISDIQVPEPKPYKSDKKWDAGVAALFDEAADCFTRNAYTATAMLCRRILMVLACNKKAEPGLRFVQYVDYLAEEVFKDERAHETLTDIKDIGNEANHELEDVSRDEGLFVLEATFHLLNSVYSLPSLRRPQET